MADMDTDADPASAASSPSLEEERSRYMPSAHRPLDLVDPAALAKTIALRDKPFLFRLIRIERNLSRTGLDDFYFKLAGHVEQAGSRQWTELQWNKLEQDERTQSVLWMSWFQQLAILYRAFYPSLEERVRTKQLQTPQARLNNMVRYYLRQYRAWDAHIRRFADEWLQQAVDTPTALKKAQPGDKEKEQVIDQTTDVCTRLEQLLLQASGMFGFTTHDVELTQLRLRVGTLQQRVALHEREQMQTGNVETMDHLRQNILSLRKRLLEKSMPSAEQLAFLKRDQSSVAELERVKECEEEITELDNKLTGVSKRLAEAQLRIAFPSKNVLLDIENTTAISSSETIDTDTQNERVAKLTQDMKQLEYRLREQQLARALISPFVLETIRQTSADDQQTPNTNTTAAESIASLSKQIQTVQDEKAKLQEDIARLQSAEYELRTLRLRSSLVPKTALFAIDSMSANVTDTGSQVSRLKDELASETAAMKAQIEALVAEKTKLQTDLDASKDQKAKEQEKVTNLELQLRKQLLKQALISRGDIGAIANNETLLLANRRCQNEQSSFRERITKNNATFLIQKNELETRIRNLQAELDQAKQNDDDKKQLLHMRAALLKRALPGESLLDCIDHREEQALDVRRVRVNLAVRDQELAKLRQINVQLENDLQQRDANLADLQIQFKATNNQCQTDTEILRGQLDKYEKNSRAQLLRHALPSSNILTALGEIDRLPEYARLSVASRRELEKMQALKDENKDLQVQLRTAKRANAEMRTRIANWNPKK